MQLKTLLLALALGVPAVLLALPPTPVPPTPWPPFPSPTPTPPPPPEAPVSGYFPMHRAWTWHYLDRKSGASSTRRFEGREWHHLSMCHRWARTVGARTEVELVSDDAFGLRLHALRTPAASLPLSPPVQIAEEDLAAGPAEHVSFPAHAGPANGPRSEWRVTLVSRLEDVTVPAGTFTHCAHFKLAVRDLGSTSDRAHADWWLAPEVGLVKETGTLGGPEIDEELVRLERN